jgi:uncharacterized cupredoxin-like copper-binding protein
MKFVRPRIIAACLAGLLALGLDATAYAHGNQAHADKAAPSQPVQQPWGIAAEPNAAKAAKTTIRTIQVSMSDAMRFSPSRIDVKQGETIKFIIKNEGQVLHEFVLGTSATLAEHAAQMLKFPNMEHDEPYMAHVKPGQTGQIVWTFNRAGEFDFACLIAGHFQAGMVGQILVSPTQSNTARSQ